MPIDASASPHQQQQQSGHSASASAGRRTNMAILWWTALKKSLSCKSQRSCDDVIKRDDDGDSRGGSTRGIGLKKSPSSFLLQPPRSGFSRSISNLRDVIHSARWSSQPPPPPPSAAAAAVRGKCVVDSPTMSVESGNAAAPGLAAWDVGAVPPPFVAQSPVLLTRSATGGGGARRLSQRKSPLRNLGAGELGSSSPLPAWASCDEVAVPCNRLVYHAGKRTTSSTTPVSALESHHLVYHAVTEVAGGETASKVVELIYSVGWGDPEAALNLVERVVKVHSMENRVERFREYTEEVKRRAARLPNNHNHKHHPRCAVDGNEQLRFHGTTVACSLGAGGSHSVCTNSLCNVCRIIRHGFSSFSRNGGGVLTTSTSKRALDRLRQQETGGGGGVVRHALLVCRVIAGRIHRPLELELGEKMGQDGGGAGAGVQPGFDSVAGKVGDDSSIEELYVLNPSAILPCFVVICKA